MVLENSPDKYKFMLNSTDITSYVVEADGEGEYKGVVADCMIVLNSSIFNIIDLESELGNAIITVQRGVSSATENYKFRGFAVNYTIAPHGVILSCKDKYYQAQTREATTSFDKNIDDEAGIISDIFTTLITRYAELDCDSSTIQPTGDVYTLDKFICNHNMVFERCDDLTVSMDWQTYYEPNTDKIYFEPVGFIEETTVLEVGTNIVNQPEWDIDYNKIVNKLFVDAAMQAVEETIYHDGDNTDAQTIQLAFTPISMEIYVGVGSYTPASGVKPSNTSTNLKTGGKTGSSSGSFDYTYDPDFRVKSIFFEDTSKGTEPSFKPLVGTNNIEIKYTYNLPSAVSGTRLDSIDSYGLHETTIKKDDIKTAQDAEVFMNNYLDRYSTPFKSSTVEITGASEVIVGRKYRVVDSVNNIDETMLISTLKWFYPYKPDEVTLGDEISRTYDFETNAADRIKRLEEKESRTTDLLINIFNLDFEFNMENRYVAGYKRLMNNGFVIGRDTIGDTKIGETVSAGFVLGSPVAGVLGTNALGQPASTELLLFLVPGDNIFKEILYDDEFYDSVESDGITWTV